RQVLRTIAHSGAIPAHGRRGGTLTAPHVASGGIGRTLRDTPAAFGFSDLLNVFLFRPDLNLGAQIKALQSRNLLQVLAEPNVLTTNGTEASFLAGGEFPFPVVQGGSVGYAIISQLKALDIQLTFMTHVLPEG